MPLSVIIPVLNEGERLSESLDALANLRALGVEVIVVDGGSRDATIQRARMRANRVITAPRGLASQLNAGAARASWDVLLFLHTDTRLPADAEHIVIRGLEQSGRAWGRFDVKLEAPTPKQRVAGWIRNLHSRMTGMATGDQAIFVKRDVFREVGGFPASETPEDIALCKRLKRVSKPLCLREQVIKRA
jgi:rSAM/selenodomain-associated transferase 2